LFERLDTGLIVMLHLPDFFAHLRQILIGSSKRRLG
jgi:hypothetical protein